MKFSNWLILEFAFLRFSLSWFTNFCNSATVISLLIFGLFFILLALSPNLKVDKVSLSLYILGEQVIIKQVLELPPKDSCKTLVKFLYFI